MLATPGNLSKLFGDFPDPFLDIASASMPHGHRSALQWAEYIWYSQGTYRIALQRIVSYFLTDVEFGDADASSDEKEKWETFFRGPFGLIPAVGTGLENRACYGNSFISVVRPFKRNLICPKCASFFPLKIVYNEPEFSFAWSDYKFVATCPVCAVGSGYRGAFNVRDIDEPEDKIKLKHWNPHEMELLHDLYTDDVAYLWRIPEDYKNQVRKGNLFHLERVLMPVVEAIKRNQMFRFNNDVIHHMKEPTLAGARNRGWGFPRMMSNFRQIYYVQVLRRFNEALALDYVIPFRLLTPMPRPGAGGGSTVMDPMMSFNMGDFSSQVRRMVRQRRRDPATWNVLPFPVQYQTLGGDAGKLAPRELMDQGQETLLNDIGTPVEMYKGTLQLQTAAPALRLFEALWSPLVHDANDLLSWLERQIGQMLNWKSAQAKLKRVTIADDINKQMALLQLMASQQISGTTALKTLGINWTAEQRQMGQESQIQAKIQSKTQDEMNQAGFAQSIAQGQPAPAQQGAGGGQGGGGGGQGSGGGSDQPQPPPGPVSQYLAGMSPNTPVQPQELMQAADTMAQGLLGLPETQKLQELRQLKQKNSVLHAIVRQRLDAIRKDARNQGGAQVMQQTFGRS